MLNNCQKYIFFVRSVDYYLKKEYTKTIKKDGGPNKNTVVIVLVTDMKV